MASDGAGRSLSAGAARRPHLGHQRPEAGNHLNPNMYCRLIGCERVTSQTWINGLPCLALGLVGPSLGEVGGQETKHGLAYTSSRTFLPAVQ